MNTKKNIIKICCFIAWIILGLFVSFCFFGLWHPPPIDEPYICISLMNESERADFHPQRTYNINTWAFMTWFFTLSLLGAVWGFLNWKISTGGSIIDEKNKFKILYPWALVYPTIITGIVVLLIVCN